MDTDLFASQRRQIIPSRTSHMQCSHQQRSWREHSYNRVVSSFSPISGQGFGFLPLSATDVSFHEGYELLLSVRSYAFALTVVKHCRCAICETSLSCLCPLTSPFVHAPTHSTAKSLVSAADRNGEQNATTA